MENTHHSTEHVRIQLVSREPGLKLPDNTGPILVSTALRRYALSTLVNNLLETDTPVPFEFLINGQFLRTTIDDFLIANGISSEVTLSVEYVRALVPPVHVASFEHDDWVSSVDVLSSASPAAHLQAKSTPFSNHPRILSASYDGLLRVWSQSGDLLAISAPDVPGPAPQAIKTACFLTPFGIASAGNARLISIWNYQEHADATSIASTAQPKGTLTPVLHLYGHRSSVDSISVHSPSSRIISASSDHTVGLWSWRKSEAPAAPETLLPTAAPGASKRRKLTSPSAAHSTPQRGPLSILKGHTNAVTAAIFAANDATVAYSTSWDHTLVTWDLVTGLEVSTRRTLHPLLCVTDLPELGLLAAGSSARHLAMIDPRVGVRDVTGMTLRGHVGAVVTAAVEPGKPWGLISGSHDGTCRIWDLRSVKLKGRPSGDMSGGIAGQVCESIYTVHRESIGRDEKKYPPGERSKVFSICWDENVGIVSAGEDKRVQVNRAIKR